MQISRAEWQEWETHPVTRAFKDALLQRLHDVTLELQHVSTEDLLYKQGYIQAYKDVADTSYEEV